MQQKNKQLCKKMRFPSPQLADQVAESALVKLLTAQLELQFTELARPGGGIVALATGEGGGHHSRLGVHAPPWLQISVVFSDVFSDAFSERF